MYVMFDNINDIDLIKKSWNSVEEIYQTVKEKINNVAKLTHQEVVKPEARSSNVYANITPQTRTKLEAIKSQYGISLSEFTNRALIHYLHELDNGQVELTNRVND